MMSGSSNTLQTKMMPVITVRKTCEYRVMVWIAYRMKYEAACQAPALNVGFRPDRINPLDSHIKRDLVSQPCKI